jgi:ATP-citrate lyase beta-subunit
VAKLDDYASYQCTEKWKDVTFPKPFGLKGTKEEQYISELDDRTGASLKLTILNPEGRVWTLVAGGGASVIFADTVVDLGFAKELANYGEYSGNPTRELTYAYTKTILKLMTEKKDSKGRSKFLIIGGGIANFTDVAKTFTGIIDAIEEYSEALKKTDVKIYVRRGGPNYKEGLANMRKMGKKLGLPVEVYGPETHMTKIVSMALQGKEV